MRDGVISVVVPVYNVEPYLKECLESITNQTYRDLEIILIDDGSTDKSGDICDEYGKKDDRIIVIHQSNHGSASAKNAGLRKSSGEYLAFVDSDDFLQEDAYEFMVKQLEEYCADIIQGCFRKVYKKFYRDVNKIVEMQILDASEFLELFTKDWTCGLLWDKLYKRDIFKDIYFKEGHKIDDEFFTYKGVINSKKIIRVPHYIYNYRQRISSVMFSKDSQLKIISDSLEYLSIRREEVTKSFPQLKKAYDEHYLNMLIILSKNEYINAEHIKEIRQHIKKYFRENDKLKISPGLYIELIKLQFYPSKCLLRNIKIDKSDVEKDLYYK
nr:glycosyltransferase family 2 protein [Catenibacterium mitsuokai]